MGDRGNIYITQRGRAAPGIYIYSHRGGSDLPTLLRDSLKRGRKRWDDEPYLARIIACDVFKVAGIRSVTGAGLTTYLTDNEHTILVVDAAAGTVGVADPPQGDAWSGPPRPVRTVTFAEYTKMSDDECAAFARLGSSPACARLGTRRVARVGRGGVGK